MKCDALLFDLDGVLIDSTECIENTWRQWAAAHGLDADVVLRKVHGRRAVESIRLLAPHLDAVAEASMLASIEAHTTNGVRAVPAAHALLTSLPRDRWAVVTSGVRAVAENRMRHVGLVTPRVMICADEVTNGKPHPEGYLAAAEALGIAPVGCVVIEDSPLGLAAARAARMGSVAIASTHEPDELRDAGAIASSLGALTVRVALTGKAHHLEIRIAD